MSEIARLAQLIGHVGCGDLDVHGRCSKCQDLREVLAGILKRTETREAEENPAIVLLRKEVDSLGQQCRHAEATLTDSLRKCRDRIVQLEEHDLDNRRRLKSVEQPPLTESDIMTEALDRPPPKR